MCQLFYCVKAQEELQRRRVVFTHFGRVHACGACMWTAAAVLILKKTPSQTCVVVLQNLSRCPCRLPLRYDHVGSPIWMYREGRDLPGNYTGYAHSRPDLYTGRVNHLPLSRLQLSSRFHAKLPILTLPTGSEMRP